VLPTAAQERFMVYDAIVNGARALGFLRRGRRRLLDAPRRRRGLELDLLERRAGPLVQQIGPASPLNAALVHPDPAADGSLRSSDPQTELLFRRTASDVWVIAARFGTGSTTVTISGLPPASRTARCTARAAGSGQSTEPSATASRAGPCTCTASRSDRRARRPTSSP